MHRERTYCYVEDKITRHASVSSLSVKVNQDANGNFDIFIVKEITCQKKSRIVCRRNNYVTTETELIPNRVKTFKILYLPTEKLNFKIQMSSGGTTAKSFCTKGALTLPTFLLIFKS